MYTTKAVESRLTIAMRLFKTMPKIKVEPIVDGSICPHCEESKTIRIGKLKNGGQRHKCKSCNRSYIIGGHKQWVYTDTFKRRAILAWQLGAGGVRSISKKFNISPNTLYSRLPIYGKKIYPWPYSPKKKHNGHNLDHIRYCRGI